MITKELKKGDSGEQVVELQQLLTQQGYQCGEINGNFGRKVEAAIRDLQTKHGLHITGTLNEQTAGVLYQKLPPTDLESRLLAIENEIKKIKERLQ